MERSGAPALNVAAWRLVAVGARTGALWHPPITTSIHMHIINNNNSGSHTRHLGHMSHLGSADEAWAAGTWRAWQPRILAGLGHSDGGVRAATVQVRGRYPRTPPMPGFSPL
jgi:hypothetical protein